MVMSDTIYKFYPDLKLGDALIVKIPGQRKELWKVVGVFRFVAMLGDPIAYAEFNFVAGQVHSYNQAASYRLMTEAHDGAALQTLTQRIDRYLKDKNYAVQGVQSGVSLRENATQAVNTLVSFLLIMAILTAFVGSIGLTGTMSMNVLERTREIGVMRTIGAVDRVIMQSVIIEALVIGLITWVFSHQFFLVDDYRRRHDGFGDDHEFHAPRHPAVVRRRNCPVDLCQYYASAECGPADHQ
jgi:putative ABC transport system permease protein